ncbi:unnamed protein product [Cochlearia groenlandica]
MDVASLSTRLSGEEAVEVAVVNTVEVVDMGDVVVVEVIDLEGGGHGGDTVKVVTEEVTGGYGGSGVGGGCRW